MRKHKGRFTAVDDTGRPYTIDVHVEIINVGGRDNPHQTREGLLFLQLENGEAVNRLGKGKYQIVSSGVCLTSDEPGVV